MAHQIKPQGRALRAYFVAFGVLNLVILFTFLTVSLIAFTTPYQFPTNSFVEFPLTWLIFPAELFSILFALYFVYCLLIDAKRDPPARLLDESMRVAIILPVYNEPKHIVKNTIAACKTIRWPGGVRIYLSDQSTNEEDAKNMKALGSLKNVTYIDARGVEGAKAGNINQAILEHVTEEYFIVFDADQAPEPEFLEETMGHFSDPNVAFVQTPQHFTNDTTPLTRAAKIGTNIFYQAQCVAKSNDGALPFCGTNAVIRADAFRSVGGLAYYTSTEDIDLGIRLNAAGYHGMYVPVILAHGTAPQDFAAYSSQQYRWSNGNLAIFRKHLARLLNGKFSLLYIIHMFFTLAWWLVGFVTITFMIVPLISLYWQTGTHHTWLPLHLLIVLYVNVVLGIMLIYMALKNRVASDRISIRDAALQYLLITNSCFIYFRSGINALIGRFVTFKRTSKVASRVGLRLIAPNLIFAIVLFASSIYALYGAAISVAPEQIRAFLPLSLWLFFYSIIMFSSILFIGRPYGDLA